MHEADSLELRHGAVIIAAGSALDEDDKRLLYPYSKEDALKELRNLDNNDILTIMEDYNFEGSRKEFMQKLHQDEKLLKKIARDFFYMA